MWRKQKKPAPSEGAGRWALFENVLNYSMDKLKLSCVGQGQKLVDLFNYFSQCHRVRSPLIPVENFSCDGNYRTSVREFPLTRRTKRTRIFLWEKKGKVLIIGQGKEYNGWRKRDGKERRNRREIQRETRDEPNRETLYLDILREKAIH